MCSLVGFFLKDNFSNIQPQHVCKVSESEQQLELVVVQVLLLLIIRLTSQEAIRNNRRMWLVENFEIEFHSNTNRPLYDAPPTTMSFCWTKIPLIQIVNVPQYFAKRSVSRIYSKLIFSDVIFKYLGTLSKQSVVIVSNYIL